ncbi:MULTISPECIES: FUSC family protein [Streptomyces]|uniref:FUSC family protein n=1 Tax=Streptomyces TaxID=1883 RepID=UPI001F1D880B|nr:FUSC family protein [Streptomyces sp. FB2]MCF2540434.1 FUSC family protein [Streptomyces sp. FB2]
MRAAEETVRTRLRDRVAASDPGLLRLAAALRTVGSIALAVTVLAVLGTDLPHLVTGALVAMVSTFAIREKQRSGQAVTLALGLPVALASMTLASLLHHRVLAGDLVFVLLIFCAVYGRRFGDRGTGLGLIGFQMYFVALFVGATPGQLPELYTSVAVGFGCSALMRFAVIPETPVGVLERLRAAFRARMAQLLAAQIELLDAGPEEADRALRRVREGTARLHETALLIQGRLSDGTADEAVARLVQRRIADAEIAAERLGLSLLRARGAERVDTLALHLPGAPVPSGGRQPVREEATETLRRDLDALRVLVLRPVEAAGGTGVAQLRNRLLGYRDEENVPVASPAVQDAFRAVGETARAVLGLRIALGGAQDESDDSPATARSREELDAEDAVLDADEEEAKEEPTGLERRTTRAAVQVAVGSLLAMVGGELLSRDRWYWAVLTCWIVFLNTASTGEILVKGSRRLLGTVLGVLAGIVLAGAVGHHTWTAFAVVLLCVFAMFYSAPLSYTLSSFFVTAALGLLYTLLHTYSLSVLVLRIGETALGAACGVIAAAFVLPVQTDRRTNDLLAAVLRRLREVTDSAVEQLSGGPPGELMDQARDLDQALADLRAAVQPLTHPATPLRARKETARYVVALLETCAYHARTLAATAELLLSRPSVVPDPRLRAATGRIGRNLEAIAAHVTEEHADAAIETGSSIASLLGPSTPLPPGRGRVTDHVLRHLQRLDEAVTGLARPLDVPVKASEG